MPLLQDKVCVITGGAGSVGLASARLFLSKGAKVMLVDLLAADLARAVQGLGSPNADAVAADVSDAASTKAYIERSVSRFGPIDVLFSNAGNQGPITPVTAYPEDAFDAQIAVHVRGAFLACKYGMPRMNDGGSIIITSSVVGAMGAPGAVAYESRKRAGLKFSDRLRVPKFTQLTVFGSGTHKNSELIILKGLPLKRLVQLESSRLLRRGGSHGPTPAHAEAADGSRRSHRRLPLLPLSP